MFDVLISGGTIVDGTGGEGYRADLGVVGEKIEAIGDLSKAQSRRRINAAGHVVSPGFIDTHAHSDAALLTDGQHPQGLRQGVTTEILGQDGLSYVPSSPANYRMYNHYLSGILGRAPDNLDMSSVAAFRANYHHKTSINVVTNIAHGALRLETCGMRDVAMTGDRLAHAKRLVREGMEQGAAGLATGMSYHPQAWSDTAELIELCKVVAEFGGVYTTHLRNVNTDRGFGGGMVPEALEIGRRTGVKVHFSHTRTAVDSAGQVDQLMRQFDDAKAEGVDLTLELYPYPTGSSFVLSNLPSQAHNGGPDAIKERLRDPEQRAEFAEHIENSDARVVREFVYSHMPLTPELEGLTVPTIAAMRGKGLGEVTLDLLLENDLEVGFWGVPPGDISKWRQVSRDAVQLLARPDYTVGSDSIHVGGHPHPRAWGAFSRFFRLRRQFPIMSLETMVQRMSDNAARRFGLTGRGRLQTGYFADIVVFDAERVIDTATYDDPAQHPVGIPFVLVNGQVAVDHERCTGVMAGQAIP